MTLTTLAGYVLIGGFVGVAVASALSPPGLYKPSNQERRQEIIERHAGRWRLSNNLWIAGSALTALGLSMLGSSVSEPQTGLLYAVGSLAFGVATAAWAVSLSRRTQDPEGTQLAQLPIPLTPIYMWGMVAGLGLFGAAFYLGRFPDSLGLVYLIEAGVVGAGLAIYRAHFINIFPPQVFYLLTLVAGVMSLRL